jgi:hypothetical protein
MHLNRTRVTLLCLLAVLSVSAVVSASASAAIERKWVVCVEGPTTEPPTKYDNHKCNTKAKPLSERKWEWVVVTTGKTEKVVSSGGEFKLVAGTKSITCKKVKDTGTITGATPGIGEATAITFEECATGQTGCKVKSAGGTFGTINVTNIPTKLEERETSTKVKVLADNFEQKTIGLNKEFVTLEFEPETGKSCSEYPATKVKGAVAAQVMETGELVFPNPELKGNTLEAFGIAAKLTGTDTQELENGWAVSGI